MSDAISLQDWVGRERSIECAARKLGIRASTLAAYCRGARCPRADMLKKMMEKLPSDVDLGLLIQARVNACDVRPAARRRLRNSILVNQLSKLEKLFNECNLHFEVENASYRGVLERWKTTNVTVGEVRDAVQKLSSSGRNASDINLIHETIAESRRQSLRALG